MITPEGPVLWFTGLSGAGKSTICRRLKQKLVQAGHTVEWLDGDDLRKELPLQLGFTKEERMKQIQIAAYNEIYVKCQSLEDGVKTIMTWMQNGRLAKN